MVVLGVTDNLMETEMCFINEEFRRRDYEYIFEIQASKKNITGNLIKFQFLQFNIHDSFYKSEVVSLIENYLDQFKVITKKYTDSVLTHTRHTRKR